MSMPLERAGKLGYPLYASEPGHLTEKTKAPAAMAASCPLHVETVSRQYL